MSKYRNSYSSYNQSKLSYDEPSLRKEDNKEPETKTGVVTNCELLNVRSSTTKTADNVLMTIGKGKEVTILETIGNWYKVETPSGETGYVICKYIEV